MGFWIFMLCMNLLTPLAMIGFGRYFARGGPKKANWAFGYRTAMSMKNQATWAFAHRHCGRVWQAAGWVMLPVSVGAMLFVLGKEIDVVGWLGGALCLAQLLVMIGCIFPTEIALRKHFDKQGNRRP